MHPTVIDHILFVVLAFTSPLYWKIRWDRTGVVGLILGLTYVFTGSLWVPILLHASIDVLSGNAAHAALDERPGLAAA